MIWVVEVLAYIQLKDIKESREKQRPVGHIHCFSAADVGQSVDRVPRARTVMFGLPAIPKTLSPTILPGTKLWLMKPSLSCDGLPQPQAPLTVEPSKKWWDCNQERILTPEEALMLQGWPVASTRAMISRHNPNLIMDLAGNAFAGNVIVSVLLALMVTLEWKASSESDVYDSSSDEDLAVLLALGLV